MHACPPTHPACCRGWGRGSARRSAPSAACRPGTPAAPTCTGGTAWRQGGLQRHNPPIPALTAELYVCPSEPQTGAGRAAWHGLQPPCCLILAGRATLSPDSKCVPPCPPPPPPLPLPVLQLLAADADGALRALRHAHLVPAALHLLARVLGAVLSWGARQGGRLGAPRECSCAWLRLPGAGPGPRSPLQPAPTPPPRTFIRGLPVLPAPDVVVLRAQRRVVQCTQTPHAGCAAHRRAPRAHGRCTCTGTAHSWALHIRASCTHRCRAHSRTAHGRASRAAHARTQRHRTYTCSPHAPEGTAPRTRDAPPCTPHAPAHAHPRTRAPHTATRRTRTPARGAERCPARPRAPPRSPPPPAARRGAGRRRNKAERR